MLPLNYQIEKSDEQLFIHAIQAVKHNIKRVHYSIIHFIKYFQVW